MSFNSTSLSDLGISLTFDNPLKSTNSLVKITFNTIWGATNNPEACEGEYRDASGNKITNVIANPNFHWGSAENESSDHQSNIASTCFATVSSTTPIAYRPFIRRKNNNGYTAYIGREHDDSDKYPILFMIEEYAV